MWNAVLKLPRRHRLVPIAIVASLIALAMVGLAVVPALTGSGGQAGSWFAVGFTVGSNETKLTSGTLAYDDQATFELNLTDERIVRVECRLEWRDNGKTPVNDPYVNLAIFNESNNLSNIAEIRAPGGVIEAMVDNPIPENATVKARNEGEAIAIQLLTVNSTTNGIGLWRFWLSAQAPSRIRPYVGDSIQYQIWVTVFTYDGTAVAVATI